MINFVKAVLAIQDYAAREELDSRELCLLLAIFRALNDLFFPDGMVEISSGRLLAIAGMNGSKRDDTLRAVREKLAERGVIEYRPGDRRSRKPAYRINWAVLGLAEDIDPKKQGKTQGKGEIDPDFAPEKQGKTQNSADIAPDFDPEKQGKKQGKTGYYNNYYYPQGETENGNRGMDDETSATGEARAREALPHRISDIMAGKHLVMSDGVPIPDLRTSPEQDKMTAVALYSLAESVPGLNAPPRLAQRLADVAREFNLSDRMLRAAILSAENANSPVAYAIGVMQDMAEHRDRTPGEWRMRREEGCSA